MSGTEHVVCRLCLKSVASNTCLALDSTFTEKLQLLLPDVKLISSINPVICNICKGSLEESHKLKRTCSSSNKLIRFLKNYLGIKHCVELKELIKGNNKKDEKWPRNEHVCRICLKSNEGAYKAIKDAKTDEFGSMLEACLSTLDENLTSNPLICKICTDTLYKMCKFIKQFTDVENKIKYYCEKFPSEKVDLVQVLEFEIKEEQQSCLQITDETGQNISNENIENRKRPLSEEHNDESAKKQKLDSEFVNKEENIVESSQMEQNVDSGNSDTVINELPYFDFSLGAVLAPHRRKIGIKNWIKQVEEVKSRLKWSEATAKHKVLCMMNRIPRLRSWFSSVVDVINWEEFKEKLMHTFAKEDDYYFNIIKMVNRSKRPTETYVEYYQERLNLLEPLNFSEKQVVSCLLGGISDAFTNCIARMGNYSTRGDLLTFFKSCDEKKDLNYSRKDAKRTKKFMDQHIEAENEDDSSMEYSFNQPKKSLIVLLEKQHLDVNTNTCQKQSEENSKVLDQTCSCCDQKGHSNLNCPLLVINKIPPLIKSQRMEKVPAGNSQQNNNLILVHENIVISNDSSGKTEVQNLPTTDKQPSETTGKGQSSLQKDNTKALSQKCACCDKLGHSSTNCPLIRSKVEVLNTQRQEKPTTNSERGCQIDNIIVVHNDNSKTVSVPTEGKNQEGESKKCSFCDKMGHSSFVCPLIDSERAARRNNIKIVLDKDRLNKIKQPNNSPPASAKDDLVCEVVQHKVQPIPKEGQGSVNMKKCSCCNKIGHTNAECPLTGLNKHSQEKPSPNNQQRCSNCNKVGHSHTNCLLIRVNNTSSKTDKTKPIRNETSTQLSQKCSSCDKVGHLTINCPSLSVKKIPLNRTEEDSSPKKNKRICLCCNQIGHSSLDCPLLGINKHDLFKQSESKTNKYEPRSINKPSQARNTTQAQENCSCCNKFGHATVNCPFYSFFNRNRPEATQTTSNPVKEAKDKLETLVGKAQNNPQQNTSQKMISNNSTDQKCCFCNKFGHSSIDCFRIRFEQKHAQPNIPTVLPLQLPQTVVNKQVSETTTGVPPGQKNENQRVLKCEFCGRVGHRLSECFFARFDRKIYDAHHTTSSSSSRQCLYCGKFGHLQPDCPKNKPPKRTTGYQKFGPGFSRNH